MKKGSAFWGVAIATVLSFQGTYAAAGSQKKCAGASTDFEQRVEAAALVSGQDEKIGYGLREQAAKFTFDFSFNFSETRLPVPSSRMGRAKQVVGNWVSRIRSTQKVEPDIDLSVKAFVPRTTSVRQESRLKTVEIDYDVYEIVDTSEGLSIKSPEQSSYEMTFDRDYYLSTGATRYSGSQKPSPSVESYFLGEFSQFNSVPRRLLTRVVGNDLLYVGGAYLRMSRVSENGRIWELKGPLGELAYFTVARENDALTLTPVKAEENPNQVFSSQRWLGRRKYPQVSEPSRNFEIGKVDSWALAREMMLSQTRVSETAREGIGKEMQARRDLVKVNRSIIESLRDNSRDGHGMSRETLADLNKSLQSDSVDQGAGVIRGGFEQNMISIKGQDIDASRVEMQSSGRDFTYVPATEVQTRLDGWIKRVDAILLNSREGNFAEIIGLYREFLIIHPFFNGNGRTSRVVLDWMLLSSGYPPVPHIRGLTEEVFYKTPVELVEDILLAYYIKERNRTVVIGN